MREFTISVFIRLEMPDKRVIAVYVERCPVILCEFPDRDILCI
jgi:hypothetical protein